MKYLDPKNDLTFRKIFGEHPHLLISFLNSVLPLEPNQAIESIEYLQPEIIPELPALKRSIVDVHCIDNFKRSFIVEMQMYWTADFKERMLFNTGKAYVRQLSKGSKYRELKPVYGLSLVDDVYLTQKEFSTQYYHHYQIVHTQITDEKIEGLELVFIELPKFKAQNFTDKKIQTLWLRFLTEIDEDTRSISPDLLSEAHIREAIDCIHKQAFSDEELQYYDQYWDTVRTDKMALSYLREQNEKLEKEKQELEASNFKLQEETKVTRIQLAKTMLKYNESLANIMQATGLTEEEINNIY